MQKFIRRRQLLLTGIMLAGIFIVSDAFAQQHGKLLGFILDSETGIGLAGASIVATQGNLEKQAASSEFGEVRIENLPFGTYLATISHIGYDTQKYRIVIISGKITTFRVELRPSEPKFEPVAVSASSRPEKMKEVPVSTTVLDGGQIEANVALSSAEVLKNIAGVDIATTGIDRREMVLRGFNNASTGATYILTDYRPAAMPSLNLNLNSFMPNIDLDLRQVEIVRGPAWTPYGPGGSAGIIHYFTKDPFTSPGTAVSVAAGERSLFEVSFRQAGLSSEKVAYKITGQIAQGNDWTLDDNDRFDAAQLDRDLKKGFDREYGYEKVNFNGTLQYRMRDSASLTGNIGFSQFDGTILTDDLGTIWADKLNYTYGQLRLQAGNFFAQTYLNKNGMGNSFAYETNESIVDNSTQFNMLMQYGIDLSEERHRLTFGLDYDRTMPETEETRHGENEDDDLISVVGVYSQLTSSLGPKLDLTLAVRADYSNIEEDFQYSPRAEAVFKPNSNHRFRAAFSRAYALPRSNDLFLDISDETLLTGGRVKHDTRAGALNGWTFDAATEGGMISASSLLPVDDPQFGFGLNALQYEGAGQPTPNMPMAIVYSAIYDLVVNVPDDQIVALLAGNGVNITEATVRLIKDNFSPDNVQVQGVANTELDIAPVDVKPLTSTMTQTFEIGYHGRLEKKMIFAIDGYYTRKRNFVSGITQLTPHAVYSDFEGDLRPAIASAFDANPGVALILQAAGLSSNQVAAIVTALAQQQGLEELGVGVVQPDQTESPGTAVYTYRNFGEIDFFGLDLSMQLNASEHLTLFGNLSYISDDFFDSSELGESDSTLYLALNAPKLKFRGGFNYDFRNGFSFNMSGRFTQAFPVASGPYIGGLPISHPDDIGGLEDYLLLDVGAGYDLNSVVPRTRIDLAIQNILNNSHREFIGAPELGRLALLRFTYSR